MTKRLWPESLMETTINLGNVVDLRANILNQGLPLATSRQILNIRHCLIIMKTVLLSWMHKDSRIVLSGTVTCLQRLPEDLLYCLILQDNMTQCKNTTRLLN
jgi:hypothetical protein